MVKTELFAGLEAPDNLHKTMPRVQRLNY